MMRGLVWLLTAMTVMAAAFLLYSPSRALFDPDPNYQLLSVYGDSMGNYDMYYQNPEHLDWPVGIIWGGEASLADVRAYMKSALGPRYGDVSNAEEHLPVWEDSWGGFEVDWASSSGNQTACFWGPDPETDPTTACQVNDGCMRHTRTYADEDYFSNTQWGHYVIATQHYDTNHVGNCDGGGAKFGWSETVEDIIVDSIITDYPDRVVALLDGRE